ncbi:MAG: PhoD-like phosphatase N-terminal domain-containing protein [Microthrixaceae bacterium]
MHRRDLLRLGAGGSLAAATGLLTACAPGPGAPPERVFAQGVASGLHSDTEVVLWSRVEPALVGGIHEVRWELAEDDGFSNLVATGSVVATAGSDHTIRSYQSAD